MGIALIVPGVNFSDANLGKVTLQEIIPLTSLSIVGSGEIYAAETYTVAYAPANTTQRGIVWSIVSGGTYATIDSSTGVLTPLEGTSDASVTIRATSTENSSIYAEKTVTVYNMKYETKSALVGDGYSRINTGYIVKQTSKISFDFSLATLDDIPEYLTLWGAYDGESKPVTRHLLAKNLGWKQDVRFGSSTTTSSNGTSAKCNTLPTVLTRTKIIVGDNDFSQTPQDGTFTKTYSSPFFTAPTVPLFIFAGALASTQTKSAAPLNLYGFQIHEGGTLVMDFVPCTLLTNISASYSWDAQPHNAGENGLWERVSNKFYGDVDLRGAFTVIA